MSFICIPGVFGRRKDREPGFDDAELAGSGAKAGSSSSSANTPRSISDRPRNSTRARLSPSQFLTPQERTPSSERTTSTSLFHGAKALQFGEFRYIDASRASNVVINTEAYALDASDRGWEILSKYASPNALHNSRARSDPPRCDEDTRVQVIGEIMDWIKDGTSPCSLLCVTGAAGSGKSALQQTIAERCAAEGILASTFFFSSTDSTRNNASTIIPTIAYQLGFKSPALRQSIGIAVKRNPLIFDQSLGSQIYSLIVQPLTQLLDKSIKIPHALLIDALDECQDEGHQVELIKAIHKELLLRDTPFRIFLTSRPEWALYSALQPHGLLHGLTYHIGLSDAYDATADIRRTLWRRLRDIGACSSFPSAQDPLWPPEEVVETIVQAASGQYIYAATVIRYVSERRASPVERLRAFLAWSSSGEEANPFAALDLLYTNILTRAKAAFEAAGNKGDFCVLLQAYAYFFNPEGGYFFPLDAADKSITRYGHDRLLSTDDGTCELLISDLRSLLGIATALPGPARPGPTLNFYHQSFRDFLADESRSKDLHVPRQSVDRHLAECFLRYFARSSERVNGNGLNNSPVKQSLNIIVGDESINGTTPPSYPWLALVSFTLIPYLLLRLQGDPSLYRILLQFTDQGGWGDVNNWMEFLLERSKRCDINIDSAAHWHEFLDNLIGELEESQGGRDELQRVIEPAATSLEASYNVLRHALRPAHRAVTPDCPEERVCYCAYHTVAQGQNNEPMRESRRESGKKKRTVLLRYRGFRSEDAKT